VRSTKCQEAGGVGLKRPNNVAFTNGLSEKIGGIVERQDILEADGFVLEEILNEVEPQIHMLGAEPILTNLAASQINRSLIVNLDNR
jgi:hypothetical protein